MPGRVLVGFEAGSGEQGRRTAAAAVDGRVVAGRGRTRVVELDRGADVRAAARRLADRPGVAFAEPDWVRRLDACDPDVCWHLQPRPGANLVPAHDDGHRGEGRTVAVVDTGVREAIGDDPATTGVDESNDLDLEDRVAGRWRCRDSGCVAAVATPTSSHGTEVASVIAAADDDDGTTGAAPDATIVSYRVDATGGGIPSSYLRSALLHIAADPAIDVVNLSLGGSQWSEVERQAIAVVLAAGKVVVASAGNTGDRVPQYPASFPGVVSVGATDDGGQIADFSSYGKVDVVAPGDCVAVAVVPGFDQDRGCPGDNLDGVAFNSGTSFSAPIVSGALALTESRSPLLARLALESSADELHPGGASDAKQWAHGLADAEAFVAAHDPAAPPALVLETSGGLGSGDGQLPHPATTYVAYAFQAEQGVAADPGSASFATAPGGTADFEEVDGEEGTYRATLGSGDLDPGLQEEPATATVDGEAAIDSVPVLALAADDQAPGVDLADLADDDAWRRVGSVDGDDLDDVYAVTLGRGDRLDVSIASRSPDPVAALLFDAGTTDVFGQLGQTLACGGGRRWAARPPGSTSRPGPAAPTCSTCSPPGRPATTASPGRCATRPACRSRSPSPPAAPTATASGTAAPGPPGRSPAGPSPRSSPAAPARSTARPAAAPAPGTAAAAARAATPSGSCTPSRAAGPCCVPGRSPWTSGGHGSPTPPPPPTRSSPGPATATGTPPASP